MQHLYIIGGIILAIIIAVALYGGMGYRDPMVRQCIKADGDCDEICSCMPEGVSCDKDTQVCRRVGSFYDRGQYCGTICRACGDEKDYSQIPHPDRPATPVDTSIAKSGKLHFTHPLGVGSPPIAYPLPAF